MNTSTPQDVLARIINQKCHGTLLVAGGTLILYLGKVLQKMTKDTPLKTVWAFWIECAWRMYDREKIVAAYFDDLEFAGKSISKIEGSILVDVKHDEMSHDLVLKFSNGVQLDVFTYSTEDEQWLLEGSDGYRYGIEENLKPKEWMSEPDY